MTDRFTGRLFRRDPTPRALAPAPRRIAERSLMPIGFYRRKAKYVIETAALVVKGGVPRTIGGLMEWPR